MSVQLRGGGPRRYTVLEVQDTRHGEQIVHLRAEMIYSEMFAQDYRDNGLEQWAHVGQLVGFSEPGEETVSHAMPAAPVA